MAVRQKGSKWQADVTVGGQRLPRFSFATKEEAEAWSLEARAAALLGKDIPIPGEAPETSNNRVRRDLQSWTLEDCFNEAMKGYQWEADVGYGKKQRQNMDIWEGVLGPKLLIADLDEDKIDEAIQGFIDDGNSGGTINRKLSTLSKSLKWARRKRRLKSLPDIQRQPESPGRIRWLSDNEERAVIHYFTQWSMDDHLDAFKVLVDTGFRPSELWGLDRQDIQFNTGLISLWRTKTSYARSIHMTDRAREVLMRRTEGGRFDPFDLGKSVSAMTFWFHDGWNKARLKMDLMDDREFIPYVCRHTCCSRLVQGGASLAKVKDWMGHKSITTTMRYAHLAPDHLADLKETLERPRAAA